MEKLSKYQKWANLNYGSKRFQRKLDSKMRRKDRKKKEIKMEPIKNRIVKFKTLNAPANYSFINNTEQFIYHLNQAKEIAKRGFGVRFNLHHITSLGFEALSLLMATTRDKKLFGRISGNIPKDPKLKRIFHQSGFISRFQEEDNGINNNLGGEMYTRVSNKSYSHILSEKCTKTIIEYTYGGKRLQSPQVHPTFVEIMKNTDDHAGEGHNRWLFYYKDEGNITKVCFLDLGKGILGSLNENISGFLSKFDMGDLSNPEKLKGLLQGNIKKAKRRTKTKEEKRGTGLPHIYKFMKHEKIKKSYVITNDVKYRIEDDTYETLKTPFTGTFYYREMHP